MDDRQWNTCVWFDMTVHELEFLYYNTHTQTQAPAKWVIIIKVNSSDRGRMRNVPVEQRAYWSVVIDIELCHFRSQVAFNAGAGAENPFHHYKRDHVLSSGRESISIVNTYESTTPVLFSAEIHTNTVNVRIIWVVQELYCIQEILNNVRWDCS